MTLADFILIGVALLGLAGLLAVVGRKLPLVSQIDPHSLPQHREERLKQAIIEERLKRKLQHALRVVRASAVPVGRLLQAWGRRFVNHVTTLEHKYRSELRASRGQLTAEHQPKLKALEESGRELLVAGELADAEKKAIEMVALDPKSADAYRLLGEVYLEMKEYAQAREVYHFLLKLNQEDADALSHLGSIETVEGHLDAAREDVERSIALNQQVASTHLQLCEIYRELGDFPQAVHECQSAVKLEPNNPRMLSALLDVAILAKDKPTAYTTLDQLKAANPENQKLDELAAQVETIGRTS